MHSNNDRENDEELPMHMRWHGVLYGHQGHLVQPELLIMRFTAYSSTKISKTKGFLVSQYSRSLWHSDDRP